MQYSWLTDIHLNFIDDVARQKFYQEIVNTGCDGVLISGDIAEAPCLVDILNEMVRYIDKPIYFVLGNHDYYRGQIQEVHDAMTALTKEHDKLFWLSVSGMQKLDNNTFLIGQDGWADGRLGNYQNSRVVLNDSRMIADLFQEKILGKYQLLEKMQQLADTDAIKLQNDLKQAVSQTPKKIIVLTHVPPFKEACLHEGKISGDDWLPYFSSKVIGDLLTTVAQKNPQIEFLVLCGHTHSEANVCYDNLVIEVGKADYCRPEIQKIILV
ncbi:MAG: metallophosphoesterase family protein [Gammaproteobacteria bacterium]